MLFPKKVKHRKWQTKRRNPSRVLKASRGATLSFGSHGLKSTSYARVRSNQIEAARRVIARSLGKTGRVWVRIFPDRPYTQKGAEVPMGKGKGELQGYEAEVESGRIIFEIDGVTEGEAKGALRKAGMKLPLTWRVVNRHTA